MHYFGPNQVKQASTNQKQDIQVKDWRNQARKEKKKDLSRKSKHERECAIP